MLFCYHWSQYIFASLAVVCDVEQEVDQSALIFTAWELFSFNYKIAMATLNARYFFLPSSFSSGNTLTSTSWLKPPFFCALSFSSLSVSLHWLSFHNPGQCKTNKQEWRHRGPQYKEHYLYPKDFLHGKIPYTSLHSDHLLGGRHSLRYIHSLIKLVF